MNKVLLTIMLSLAFGSGLSAQAYLKDLQAGNIDAVEKKIKTLGLVFGKEPLLALYFNSAPPTLDVVKALLQKKASVSATIPGSTLPPLYIAVGANASAKIIGLLLDSGASIFAPQDATSKRSIIDFAISTGQSETAVLLIRANAKSKTKLPIDPANKALAAAALGDLKTVKSYLSGSNPDYKSLWRYALYGESKSSMQLLIDLGTKPDSDTFGSWMADHTDYIDFFAGQGITLDENQRSKVEETLIQNRRIDLLVKLGPDFLVKSRQLHVPAVLAGTDYFRLVSHNFADLDPNYFWSDDTADVLFQSKNYDILSEISKTTSPKAQNIEYLYQTDRDFYNYLADNAVNFHVNLDSEDVGRGFLYNIIGTNNREDVRRLADMRVVVDVNMFERLCSMYPNDIPEFRQRGLKVSLPTGDGWDSIIASGNVVELKVLMPFCPKEINPVDVILGNHRVSDAENAFIALLKSGYQFEGSVENWQLLTSSAAKYSPSDPTPYNYREAIKFVLASGQVPPKGIQLDMKALEN